MPIPLGTWEGDLGSFELRGCEEDSFVSFVPFDDSGRVVGLVCHAGCYALLTEQLKFRLKLSDVQYLAKTDSYEAHLMQGDYGGMLAYQDQVGAPVLLNGCS